VILSALVVMASVLVGPQEPTYVKVYDIRDLMHVIPEFSIETRLSMESALRRQPFISNAQNNIVTRETFDVGGFINLLHDLVDPNNNGPTDIRYWKGSLIVNTTKGYHDRLELCN
jgi:hypothetical protein